MKINILEDESKSMVVEFEEVDRGIPELIKEKIAEGKDVEFVGVVKEHPEAKGIRLIVRSEKNAKGLIVKAVEGLQEDLKDLASQIPKK